MGLQWPRSWLWRPSFADSLNRKPNMEPANIYLHISKTCGPKGEDAGRFRRESRKSAPVASFDIRPLGALRIELNRNGTEPAKNYRDRAEKIVDWSMDLAIAIGAKRENVEASRNDAIAIDSLVDGFQLCHIKVLL